MNQELYNQLLGAAAVMAEVKKCDEAIQKRYSQINYSEDQINDQEKIIKNAKHSYHAMTAWGVVLMIVGFGNAGILLLAILEVLSDPAAVPFIVFVVIFFILGIFGLFMRNMARVKRKKYIKKIQKGCDEAKKMYQARIKKLEEEVETIKNGLKKFGEENEYLMEFLPVKYRWPDAIYFMLQAVENLRADSLKEVINLYEQELHLLEQERILNNNALMQQRYNESLEQMMQIVDANQQQINSNLKFVQTLQILSLFDD